MARSWPLSFSAARRAALPAMNVVRLAWAPTSHGFTAVSELTTSTRSSGTPSVSATIIASTVSEPCPISVAPGDQRDAAEVVELDDGAAAVGAVDARAAADVEHAGVADAALPAGRRRRHARAAISSVDRVQALAPSRTR